jgi:DNA-binding transcriptional ArsR family regulator
VKQADIRIEADAEYVQLLKALAHPVRLDLMAILSYREISPKEFADHRNEPISNLSYHFRILRELGYIEVVSTKRVRGATEHTYRRVKEVVFSDRDWLILPAEVRQILASTTLRHLVGRISEALQAGTFTVRSNPHISWRPLLLDELGWKVVTAILLATYKAVTKAEMNAADRMQESGETGFEATVALLSFESPRYGSVG